VNVRSHRAAQGQAIRAGLLLANAIGRSRTALQCEITPHQVRPGDSRFGFEQRRAAVEPAHLVEFARIEQPSAAQELLATHGMAGAGDGQRLAAGGDAGHQLGHFVCAARLVDPRHGRAIQR